MKKFWRELKRSVLVLQEKEFRYSEIERRFEDYGGLSHRILRLWSICMIR